jgi:hypothetical protein
MLRPSQPCCVCSALLFKPQQRAIFPPGQSFDLKNEFLLAHALL